MADSVDTRRPVDWRQRAEALDPGRSFIVQAPAGSGKTGLLTQRFLRLLTTVEQPEEIVAITFTRKAASEMRGRVLGALAGARGPEPGDAYGCQTRQLALAALEHAEQQGWDLLRYPQRLRIRTIDALNAYLLRQAPLESGLGEAPAADEQARELYRAAAQAALTGLEEGDAVAPALERLLGALDNRVDRLLDLVADMLARREQWLRPLLQDNPREAVERSLRRVVGRHLAQLQEAFPADAAAALPALARYAADHVDATHPLAACRGRSALPGSEATELPAWRGLADLLLTARGSWRSRIDKGVGFPPGPGAATTAKEGMSGLLRALQPEEGLARLLHELRRLPDPGYSGEEWELVQSLFNVLRTAAGHLELLFLEQGRADFSGIALAAQRALGAEDEPTDLALRLDYRLRHLLVDEFQDTSVSQCELFRRLIAGWQPGDGRTLFLVGDPMQSIYRFRQAEVGLFLDAWHGRFGPIALQPLALTVNFRSQAGVVDWVNRVFPGVLPPTGDTLLGAVPYAPAAAWHPSLSGPAVTVHPAIGRDDGAEARSIVDIVETSHADDPQGTIAVLVRGKAHLEALIPALREKGLRFQAVEIGALQQRQAVLDVQALALALLHPADRLHWLALLHGPMVGLTLADLHRLAASEGAPPDATLPALLGSEDAVAKLSDDGRQRCRRAWSVLGAALEERERSPLRHWVEGAWLALGGPLCLPDESAAEDVEVYLQLLQDLDQRGISPTPERLRDAVAELFACPDPRADGRLQLMTIHKAKGLEFDTVILPGLGKTTRRDDARLLYWLETTGEDGAAELFFGPVRPADQERDPPTSAYIRGLEAEQARHESGRLLYVAATRARRRLHLLGHATLKQDGQLTVAGDSLLGQLWPAVRPQWEVLRDALERVDAVAEAPPPAYVVPGGSERLRIPGGWNRPPPPPAVGAPGGPEGIGEEAVVYEWAGDAARVVGTVVHRFLQQLAQREATELAALPAFEPMAQRLLLGAGLPQREVGAAVARVREALERTLADERGRWILSTAHAERRSELPLTALIDGRVRHLVVDRSFIDADGVRWIIDYKTGTHAGGDPDGFLAQEEERYRAQLSAYAAAFRALEERPVRAALYYPLVAGGWREVPV